MKQITAPVPAHVTLNTVSDWVDSLNPGHVVAVMPMQFEYQCKPYGFNWAWVMAWAAVATDNFRDRRWWDRAMLPDPETGKWPEVGSQRWSLEIRLLCDRLVECLRREVPLYKLNEANNEYARLIDLARKDAEGSHPEPPPAPSRPPKPDPEAPAPTPTPGPKPPAAPWLKQLATYAAMLLPVVTFVLWLVPIPGPVKEIIKWIFALLSGLGG